MSQIFFQQKKVCSQMPILRIAFWTNISFQAYPVVGKRLNVTRKLSYDIIPIFRASVIALIRVLQFNLEKIFAI